MPASDDYAERIAARIALARARTTQAKADVEKRLSELEGEAPAPKEPALLVPDGIEPVTGWRTWGIETSIKVGETPFLHSVSQHTKWVPRRVQTAVCASGRCGTDIPGEQCGCGNYSAKTYEHLLTMAYHFYDGEYGFNVIGEVANWGKVIEGTQGWRALHSYPKSLYIPYEAWHLAEGLQLAWGVPVRLKNFLKPVVNELDV